MRKQMIRLFLILLLAPGLCLPAKAAAGVGSIQVTLRSGQAPVTGGTVMLYRVGEKVPEGYRIVDSFGGGLVYEKDALSPHLAQWLAQMDVEAGLTRILDADGKASFSNLEEGLYLLIQTETAADFYPILPFLMILPYEGQWNIEAHPFIQQVYTEQPNVDSPRTGQHPAPFLGAAGMVVSGIGLALCVGRKRKG